MPVEKPAILQRLRTAGGHLQAVSQLLEDDKPCQQILHQLNAIQCALEATSSLILCMEVERCLQAIHEDPCSEQRCEELARLSGLYSLLNKPSIKLFETS